MHAIAGVSTIVELFLRLNLPRENDWLDSIQTDFSTLVISANVLETFFATTIKSVNNRAKPYLIDPLTYIFSLESVDLSPKRWYSKLVSHYGLDLILPPGTTTVPLDRMIVSGQATDSLKGLVENVIDYQRQRILASPEYSDFLDVEAFEGRKVNPSLFAPRFLIPPYFYVGYDVEDISDVTQSEWLRVNIECAKHAVALKRSGEKIYVAILISKSLLYFPDQIEKLVSEYSINGVDGFLLWVSDFREQRESDQALLGLVRLVSALVKLGKPIYNLYGGMFSLLLSSRGLSGACHSICYGESKDPFAESGMLATVRYYDQDMKTKVPYGKLAEFLKLTDRSACDCQHCIDLRTVVGDSKSARGKRIELTAKHFLLQRSREIIAINAGESQKIISGFNQMSQLCEQKDYTKTYRDFYIHLEIWNKILSS